MSSSLLLQLVNVICGFVVPHAIISTFGSDTNGLISSITQFLTYITLLEAGFGPLIKSILFKPIANNSKKDIEKILKSSERFFHNIAKIFILYVIALCLIYPHIVNTFEPLFTVSLIVILAVSIFTEYFFGITYSLYLQAEQKNYIISRIQTATTIVNAIVTILLINCGFSIQIVKLLSTLVIILKPIILSHYVKNKYQINLPEIK